MEYYHDIYCPPDSKHSPTMPRPTPDIDNTNVHTPKPSTSVKDEARKAPATKLKFNTELTNDDITSILRDPEFVARVQKCVANAVVGVLADSINPLKDRVTETEKSIESLTEKLEETRLNEVAELQKSNKQNETDIKNLNERVDQTDIAEIEKLREIIDDLEQQTRLNNLIISGIIEQPGENLTRTVIDLAKTLNVNITPSDIASIFRAGKAINGRPRIILVKFAGQKPKRDLYKARTKLKKEQTDEEKRNNVPLVFINEDLTIRRSKLFKIVRDGCKGKDWSS